MKLRTKELPEIGALGQAKKHLYTERLWEIEVKFVESIQNLGISCNDRNRTDVYAFDNNGSIGGWQGQYGGSNAAMFSNSKSAIATSGQLNLKDLPENTAILEIVRSSKANRVTLYVNKVHEIKLIQETPKDIDLERTKMILYIFKGLKAAYRQEPLNKLEVTTQELTDLVTRGWLKCHKGKTIKKLDKPIWKGLSHNMENYYDLAGAKITTEGKNVVGSFYYCP